MVIEFAPKPQLPSTVDKTAAPKKPVDATNAELASAARSVRSKAGKTSKETVEKDDELF